MSEELVLRLERIVAIQAFVLAVRAIAGNVEHDPASYAAFHALLKENHASLATWRWTEDGRVPPETILMVLVWIQRCELASVAASVRTR